MSKLEQAIDLCKDQKDNINFSKGLKLFDDLIMNRLLMPATRAKATMELYKIAKDEAIDKITRSRDSIPFLKNSEEADREAEFLTKISKEPTMSSHERLMCAVSLYNNDFVGYCYDLFMHIMNDISVLIKYRVDASRYLLYSEIDENVLAAKRAILKFIDTKEYPSEYRYNIISSFNTKTGLFTLFNATRLDVKYSEKFLYKLQNKFFWNKKNGRERILSGQHMLSMSEKNVSDKEKRKIIEELFDIAENGIDGNMDENIRADAVDVIVRLGNARELIMAQQMLGQLGERGKKTMYHDKQNIHDSSINKSVNEYIEQLGNTTEDVENFQNVHTEISKIIYSSEFKSADRIKAFKSLNRISIDTATFTKKNLTTAEVCAHIWRLINKHKPEEIEQLKKRLVEEMIDMADTCSTGHVGRLVNVLSGYDFALKISWEEQVNSNISARLETRIKNIKDEELQEKIVVGMSENCEDEDRDAYIKFIEENAKSLKEELYKEFVEEGYINSKQFEKYFESGIKNFVS